LSTCPGLLGQGLPASRPAQSTSFLAEPMGAGIPEEPAVNNALGAPKPAINANVAGNGFAPEMVQSGAVIGSRSTLPMQAESNQTLIPTAPGTQTSGMETVTRPDPFLPSTFDSEQPMRFEEAWSWQFLPSSLLYKSYLAGGREPRFASQWIHEKNSGWLWDVSLGGRAGIVRYGTVNSPWPEGWQIDIEGAAFPRLNLEHERDLDAVDYRFGIPLTMRRGSWQGKFGYYHLSSHMGDELMVRDHSLYRINYVRETMILGVGYFLNPNIRLYSEAAWAFYTDGGAKPWEFQFGLEYSPIEPTYQWAAPFVAMNTHLREENDFGGNFTFQTGLQWRGHNGQLLRLGMQYFNGMSDMYQFFPRHEEQIGLGLWYDF
jgi:hypothetical protein